MQDITGYHTPIVGSFSISHFGRKVFFEEYSELLRSFKNRGVLVAPQWLPPIAWYFGGSVDLNIMNEQEDADFIREYNLNICLDICHMILGRNYFNFSTKSLINTIDEQIKHVHIADAAGIDGEGLQIGTGEDKNMPLIKKSLNYDCMKVVEVWQGHLNNGSGFKEALTKLTSLYG